MKRAYDIGTGSTGDLNDLKEDLLNNKVYGILTDGVNWSFLCYQHCFDKVSCSMIHFEKIKLSDFFKSMQ
jgi:hypothetical protein